MLLLHVEMEYKKKKKKKKTVPKIQLSYIPLLVKVLNLLFLKLVKAKYLWLILDTSKVTILSKLMKNKEDKIILFISAKLSYSATFGVFSQITSQITRYAQDFVHWLMEPIDNCVENKLSLLRLYVNNGSHFLRKWICLIPLGDKCFLEESYKWMQNIPILKFWEYAKIMWNLGVCL